DEPASAGLDLKAMLGRKAGNPAAERLNRTEFAQPAVFVIDYAMAKLWMSWGIVPDAVIGHSLGEYAAACIAGVLSLEDALALVADRARMIQELPGGAMLAVSLDESAVRPLLTPELAIATVNAPGLTVVSGPEDAVAALQGRLAEHGHVARRLATTHAFHSPMMQPVAGRLAERAAAVKLSPPRIPMISNVTGTWLTDQEATDPAYWTRHLLGTVRFAQGVAELLAEPGRVLLEVGPGQTLSTFVRQRPEGGPAPAAVVPSLRYAYDRTPDPQFLVDALGRLWIAGVSPDWKAFRAGERRRRVRLPTYPWERQRYWIEAPRYDDEPEPAQPARAARSDAVSTGTLAWTRAPLPAAPESPPRRVLLLGDGGDAFHALASALERAGHAVTAVRPGDGFGGGGGAYTLRLDARDDYRALADVLARDDAWPDAAVHAVAGEAGFASVLLLAAALGGAGREIDLLLAAPVGGEITGGEPLSPHAAAVIGTSLLVPLQFPSLRCRVVALPGGELPPALADRVAEEVAAGADEPLVAYRGGERWARGVRGGAAGAVASASPESAGKLYERPEQDTEYHAPTNETEERIAALWQELLGIERIGIHDDFFALGGHSLLATQIVARVRDMFQLELPLQAIFEAPTVARFAALVEEAIIAELEAMNEDEAAGLIG
ncbi:MAG TPA: acyltransferase domain-containing protein, partial [Longimicrobium sp.]|nr:acyltransferase domain-containing protein [Longimicrobium sp.]